MDRNLPQWDDMMVCMMATRTKSHRFYLPELDGLRFIAFLLVFIHNSGPILSESFLKVFSEYSWFGVDLFFGLSAFLITKLLINEYEVSRDINIRNFYIRRALRIWPLYFFYIAVASSIVVLNKGWSLDLLKHIAGLTTFTFNFVYFALLPSPILIFIHLWSISYEEQFYAIIPWLLQKLLVINDNKKWAFIFGIFLLGNSVRALLIYLKVNPSAIYILPFTRFESVLGGIAMGLGLLDQVFREIRSWVLTVAGIFCLGLVYQLPNTGVIGWSLVLTYLLVGIGVTLIIFSCVSKGLPLITKILRHESLVFSGKISYGLYIFHLESLVVANRIATDILHFPLYTYLNMIATLTLGFILTVFFSLLSYHWIEAPFLKLKERFSIIKSRPA